MRAPLIISASSSVWSARAYGVSAIAVGAVLGFVLQGRTLRWLARGRTPTRHEARRALRAPLDLAILTGALWVLGAVVMAILAIALDADAGEVFGLSGGLVLSGLTTAGVTYMIAAAVGRPVSSIALQVYPPTESVFLTLRMRMLVSWLLASGIPLLGIILILASPHGRSHIIGASLFASVAALVVGIATASALSRSIGEPLRTMVTALERVGRGDLTISVNVDDSGEIGMLQRGINDMVAGLRERERIQDLFGQHVGPAVAEEAIRSGVTARQRRAAHRGRAVRRHHRIDEADPHDRSDRVRRDSQPVLRAGGRRGRVRTVGW